MTNGWLWKYSLIALQLLEGKSIPEAIQIDLGDDTDTVAAIAEGLAGIYYGLEEISKEWLLKLQNREYL